MTFVSLALLGSMRGWRKPEVANIKSTSTGPNNGERLQGWDPMAMVETQKRFPDLIKHFCGVTRRNDIKDSLFGTHHGYSVRILSEYES